MGLARAAVGWGTVESGWLPLHTCSNTTGQQPLLHSRPSESDAVLMPCNTMCKTRVGLRSCLQL